MVSTRTTIGSIGLLADHEPLLARLEPTELRLYRSESDIVRFAQAEGYVQMSENRRAACWSRRRSSPRALDAAALQRARRARRARALEAAAPEAARSRRARAARPAPRRGVPRDRRRRRADAEPARVARRATVSYARSASMTRAARTASRRTLADRARRARARLRGRRRRRRVRRHELPSQVSSNWAGWVASPAGAPRRGSTATSPRHGHMGAAVGDLHARHAHVRRVLGRARRLRAALEGARADRHRGRLQLARASSSTTPGTSSCRARR